MVSPIIIFSMKKSYDYQSFEIFTDYLNYEILAYASRTK